MDKILSQSKSFEYLVTTLDPAYNDLVIGIEIVKKFITEHQLIVYGGSAIDYALRLKGSNIYPDDMLQVPDLDFYSPNNVEHAYQLADLLYIQGYKEARAIAGMHAGTMRVDIMSNHFIADISYKPKEVFDKMPYLIYNDMRIIHPTFQRIDIHSSLSFPYDDVPREVIFARWSKDIKRFNKLVDAYPISGEETKIAFNSMNIPLDMKKYVFHGFAAYALIYTEFVRTCGENSDIIPAKFRVNEDSIHFSTPDYTFEIVNFNITKAAAKIGITGVEHYEPYSSLLPERVEGYLPFCLSTNPAEAVICESYKMIIHNTKNRLLSVNSIKIEDLSFRVVNVQYLLKYFLSKHFMVGGKIYLSMYTSLMKMLSVSCQLPPVLLPSVQTYGSENINVAREIALNRLHHDLSNESLLPIPKNYYPDRRNPHPIFDPEKLEFFRESGRKIVD